MSSKSLLEDREFCLSFAVAVSEGGKDADLAEAFGINRQTSGKYRKDPRVLKILQELGAARTENITRKIDNEIQRRLTTEEQLKKLDTKTLLDIRKTLAPKIGNAPEEGGKGGSDAQDIWNMIEDNPELAAGLREMFDPTSSAIAPAAEEAPDGDSPAS